MNNNNNMKGRKYIGEINRLGFAFTIGSPCYFLVCVIAISTARRSKIGQKKGLEEKHFFKFFVFVEAIIANLF